jgi:hypothetical protein
MWWYNWGPAPAFDAEDYSAALGIEFVPMQFGRYGLDHLDALVFPEAATLLGFNEPNLWDQANLTPAEAAVSPAWPRPGQPPARRLWFLCRVRGRVCRASRAAGAGGWLCTALAPRLARALADAPPRCAPFPPARLPAGAVGEAAGVCRSEGHPAGVAVAHRLRQRLHGWLLLAVCLVGRGELPAGPASLPCLPSLPASGGPRCTSQPACCTSDTPPTHTHLPDHHHLLNQPPSIYRTPTPPRACARSSLPRAPAGAAWTSWPPTSTRAASTP